MRLARSRTVLFALVATLAAASTLAACPSSAKDEPPATTTKAAPTSGGRVDGATAKRLVKDGATLLDVRSPEEFGDEHVDGAINIPVDQLASRLAELPKDGKLVVYCQSGRRSARAVELLVKAGYQAHDLGAMDNW